MNQQAAVQAQQNMMAGSSSDRVLQRQCACGQHTVAGEECEECRQKREGVIQRAAVSAAPTNGVPSIVQNVLASSGQPLDTGTREFMEPRFGHDFSGVRVHTDARAAESAQAVNALAYTVRRDVVFGAGQYTPETVAGKRLLAHELTHVVQQNSGLQAMGNSMYNDSLSPVEREADAVAHRIVSGLNIDTLSNRSVPAIQLQSIDAGTESSTDAGTKTSADAGSASGPRYITSINVDMKTPQNVSLNWSDGSPTTGIECSTGQGHCCPRPCDPPLNAKDGSNCTPNVSGVKVDNKYRRTSSGLNYFVSFVPARSIGLHEYSPVDGTPLSHGCVRLHRADAMTVYSGTVPDTTTVTVNGLAVPNCPRPGVPTCRGAKKASTSLESEDTGDALAQNLDEEALSETDPAIG